jgi:hypothetical protein
LVAVTAPLEGEYVAFQPLVMTCPAGRVNTSDQPSIVALPLLVIVMEAVSPVFQALAVYPTPQPPGPAGEPLDGELLDGEPLDGWELDGWELDGEPLGCDDWNCEKKLQTSPLVQVLAPLSPPPSTGPGVWPPSNAAHFTGYPALHPE